MLLEEARGDLLEEKAEAEVCESPPLIGDLGERIASALRDRFLLGLSAAGAKVVGTTAFLVLVED